MDGGRGRQTEIVEDELGHGSALEQVVVSGAVVANVVVVAALPC